MREKKRNIKSDLKKVDARRPRPRDYDDAPELTDAQLARAVVSDGIRLRGRPKSENPKIPVSLRLDADVVRAFKSTGPGWQTLVNDTLRKSTVVSKFKSPKSAA